MSCGPGIYTRLPMTSPPGGNWTYIGYNATSDTGPWTGTPVVPLVNVAANTSLASWGYDFTLAEDGKTPGYYRFTYNYVGGSDSVTIRVQSNTICAGQNAGITIEQGDTFTLNLFTLISGGICPSPQTGGTWTNVDSSPGFNTGTGVLTTGSVLEGTYHFEYTISASEVLECDSCLTTATVTLTVASPAALDATIAKSDVSCVYTYNLKNGVTATANSVNVSAEVDSRQYNGSFELSVINCDTEEVFAETLNLPIAEVYTSISTVPLLSGGYFESIKLRTSTGADIIVPIGPLTATYTGVGGTTNATELTYNSSAPHVIYNALTIAIKNYLGVLAYVSGTHYVIQSIGPGSAPNEVKLSFGCKDDPTTTWIGLRTSDARIYYYDQLFSYRNTLGAIPTINPIVITRSFSSFPCFSGINALTLSFSIPGYLYAESVNFNSLPVATANIAVTPAGSLSRSCTDKLLTANATGCAGTVSYEWQTGATTQSIKVPYIAGATHTVEVSCTSPSSSVTKSTTL